MQEHRDHDHSADPDQHVVAGRRGRALLAVGAARPERHEARAVLVVGLEDEVRHVVGVGLLATCVTQSGALLMIPGITRPLD